MPDFLYDSNQSARQMALERQWILDHPSLNSKLQRLAIEETGPSPIRLILRGSTMPVVGAEFPVKARGGTYMPLGAKQGTSTVTGVEWDVTEFTFKWEVPFFNIKDDVLVTGATIAPKTPEDLFKVFQEILSRGREVVVQLGVFSRRGILREARPKPNRGYLVDPTSGDPTTPGTNLEVIVRFEWSGEGIPLLVPEPAASVEDVNAAISAAAAEVASVLDDEDPFAPDLFEALGNALSNLQSGISQLRNDLKKMGDFAKAPAKLANKALGTLRSVGNLWSDLENTVSSVGDEYLAVADNASSLFRARNNKGKIRDAATKALNAIADAIAAIESRKKRVVGVRPGQSLVEVAKKELGSADRWQEIADLNGISGQRVPAGTYSVEVQG